MQKKISDKYLHHITNFILLLTVNTMFFYSTYKGLQHRNDELTFFSLFILCLITPETFEAGKYFFTTCIKLTFKKKL